VGGDGDCGDRLNLTLGYAGQISLAQGAFVGMGAYTAAILTTHGWPLALALLIGPLLCFVIGWLLGYPALACTIITSPSSRSRSPHSSF